MQNDWPNRAKGESRQSQGQSSGSQATPIEWHDDRPKEECGVIGVYSPDSQAARQIFFALFALQHRGQESAGIAVTDGHDVRMHRAMGLISQVFDEEKLLPLVGDMGIGHTRYSTSGASVLRNAQPIYCTSSVGEIAVAHNGNLINANQLRQELVQEGETLDTTADSEVIARLLVKNLHLGPENAVSAVMKRIKGAYSVTVLTPNMVLGFRDPNGVRPLVAGRIGSGWMVASESCAFWPVGGEVEHEVGPGEVVIIDQSGMRFAQAAPKVKDTMCLFEFIYFARPDSEMYGEGLYQVRENMGRELAKEQPVDADVVVPVPDSGIPAAQGFSQESGIPFHEAMMKSRYIHRTFIQPDQRLRELGVRMKLAPLKGQINGKRIVLVDDSIVRATTTKQIVKLLFDCGAREVHVRITAPPIKYPCFYGIDMASKGELAAAVMSIPEICKHLGANTLGYLSIEGASRATGGANGKLCLACFNGEYPISVPAGMTKMAFEEPPDVGQLATVTRGQGTLDF
ncbi:MAG: amidophosphoribosyltransferase [Chthonomonadaceae bacterium]|nr:amidophosphoribosyltransferase [Chthonomonadaceae bacterium]